ncbi:MAG TPA: DMT family transporter [Gaiellaceae bacterium]
MRHRLPADVLLLVTVILYSFNFTAARYALTHGFAPLAYSSFRFGLGAILFTGVTFAREHTLRIGRSDIALALLAATLGIWLNQISFGYATKLTTAATVALTFGTMPILVALLSRVLGLERLTTRHYLAALISFAGVGLVAGGSGGQISGELGGVLLGLAAAATWAGYSVAIAPLMRRYSPYRISAVMLLVGCLPLFATSAAELAAQDWSDPTTLAWAGLLYGVVFSLVITNVLWFTAIDRVGAARASLYANLQPFLGAVFALLILSETISSLQIAGGLVIGAGIVLSRLAQPPVANID